MANSEKTRKLSLVYGGVFLKSAAKKNPSIGAVVCTIPFDGSDEQAAMIVAAVRAAKPLADKTDITTP